MLDSVVRTVVPYVVGIVITYAAKAGFDLDDASVASIVTTVVGTLYYIIVRFLERHFSAQWGWLLGMAKQPVYINQPPGVGTPEIESENEGDVLDENGNVNG